MMVLTGGVLAAFIGPEAAQATKTLFGTDMEYLASFILIAILNIIMIVLQLMVQYPQPLETQTQIAIGNGTTNTSLKSLLFTRQFMIPALIASFSWSIMAMPMSTVRLAMGQLGYTSRQSLLTLEFHFLGKFAPGFVTGKIIQQKGAVFTTMLSIAFFAFATVLNLVSDEHSTVATWMLGLVLIGVGWNLGFSASTVMLTEAYSRVVPASSSSSKSHVQAANDCIMMLAAGAINVSTGFIYEAGGGGVDGWRAVNYATLGLITLMCGVVLSHVLVHVERMTTSMFVKGRC
jgi:stage V sporulation protein SpoVS